MGPDVSARPLSPPPADSPGLRAPARRSQPREILEAVLVAVVLALFVRTFLFQAFAVPTPSMERTVLAGDHVVVNKFVFAPRAVAALDRLLPRGPVRRGDLIVFKFPEDPRRDFVKRAIGLPGDAVEIRGKSVLVDGRPESGTAAFHSDPRVRPDDPELPEGLRRRDNVPLLAVPPQAYFALGDNRDNSNDSRFWGPVPAANLKGRPLFVYWSYPPGGGTRRGGAFGGIVDFFRSTRWSRTFLPVR
jgi:signal peptidase I